MRREFVKVEFRSALDACLLASGDKVALVVRGTSRLATLWAKKVVPRVVWGEPLKIENGPKTDQLPLDGHFWTFKNGLLGGF